MLLILLFHFSFQVKIILTDTYTHHDSFLESSGYPAYVSASVMPEPGLEPGHTVVLALPTELLRHIDHLYPPDKVKTTSLIIALV